MPRPKMLLAHRANVRTPRVDHSRQGVVEKSKPKKAKASSKSDKIPCCYRGDVTRDIQPDCGGCGKVKVYACSCPQVAGGECTLEKPSAGLPTCKGCISRPG